MEVVPPPTPYFFLSRHGEDLCAASGVTPARLVTDKMLFILSLNTCVFSSTHSCPRPACLSSFTPLIGPSSMRNSSVGRLQLGAALPLGILLINMVVSLKSFATLSSVPSAQAESIGAED